ncbi:MAG: DUF4175 family protein [Gemmatimonadetes bacterium]|nr:DUF4175 family protein [Gemmatimonadota bacterium]
MTDTRSTSRHEALLAVIRAARNRWRLKVALQGTAVFLGGTIVLFLLSGWGMDYFRFGPAAVIGFRVFSYATIVALAWRFLIHPLRRRVSDETVALYLEEHEPSLEGALVGAVDAGASPSDMLSPALVERLIQSAEERCRRIEGGRRVERQNLYRSSGIVAGVTLAGVAVAVLSPAFLRNALPLLLVPWKSANAASVYAIQVTPGNAKLARGADQKIGAQLKGFNADQVDISVRTGATAKWERLPMVRDDSTGDYGLLLLDVDSATDYFVEASGVRSPVYHIQVADIPYVKQVDLEYHYPAYTGLGVEKIEDGGDIAALPGTQVQIRATTTLKASAGVIRIEGKSPVPLVVEPDGHLSATITVEQPGFYQIELQGPDGTMAVASPDYAIDVLSDRAPTISFSKPGRDTRVTPIEEVFAEATAQDDYGIRHLELIYSVNGQPEQTVDLYRGGRRALKDVSAGHTFFLEELKLEPGDFISYYARATDGRPQKPQVATTDIYFMNVTPFGREYRSADSRGAGGGSGGADGELSQRQREIIAATFKIMRDRGQYLEREFEENITTVKLAQTGLREQVETLIQRMNNRGVMDADSGFRKIGGELPQAAKEMEAAEDELGKHHAKEALPPEQRALKFLQRAEAVFREVQVSQGQNGGGGGGTFPNAEDLADLFELELDKLQNQYEMVQRGQREQADNQLDETLQKLKELARRQEQENERLRRLGSNLQQAGGGNAEAQRQLAQQTEELARQLERLSREQSLPEAQETARRLQQAAEAMRRSAAAGQSGRAGEGAAALDRLEEARRLLQKNQTDRLARDAADAQRQAEQLAEEQRKIQSEVQGLKGVGQNKPEDMSRLLQRKDQLAQGVAQLESQLDDMSRNAGREQREAGRKLEEAANGIRDDKLKEKIRFSKGVVAGRSPEYAREFENEITKGVEGLRQRVADAAGTVNGAQSKENQLEKALTRARDLARGMEALDERIREQQQDGQTGRRADGQSPNRPSDRLTDRPTGEEGQQGEGQQGQQQGDGQGGGRLADRGGRTTRGGVVDGGDGRGYAWGPWSPEDIRQYSNEFRQRRREAEALREELQRRGQNTADLKALIERLKQLEDARIYGNPMDFEKLRLSVVEGMKQFEYGLRRKIEGGEKDQLFLSGSDEVPPGYREMVEEYYRSLSRGSAKTPRTEAPADNKK